MPETLPTTVPQPISDFFAAANAFDSDGMIAPFTDDGLLNDIQREFWGPAAIKRWADKESVGDHVITTDFTDVKEHHGSWIISAAIDGEYDKTGLNAMGFRHLGVCGGFPVLVTVGSS